MENSSEDDDVFKPKPTLHDPKKKSQMKKYFLEIEQDSSEDDGFKDKHKKRQFEDMSLNCKFCNKKFTLTKNRLRHEREGWCQKPHDKSNPKVSLNCKVCEKKFTSISNLHRHERDCGKSRFMCICGDRFESKRFLSRHIKKNHSAPVPYSCTFCRKSFKRKHHCTRHEASCSANPKANPPRCQCAHCGAKFCRKEILRGHLRKCSSEKPKKRRKRNPCLIPDCNSSFFHKQQLIDHLRSAHKDQIIVSEKKSINFSSKDEFLIWKEKEEIQTHSYFTARRGQGSRKIQHFYCQHDGCGKTHNKNYHGRKTVRRNKKGRIKVGHHCFSKMKLVINDDKTVKVDYYPTHSHICKEADILHHPLLVQMSKFIDEKLAENIPPYIVYKLAKECFIPKYDKDPSPRAYNLTKKIVLERGRARDTARRLHEDDAESVFLLAEKLIAGENNPLLVYKPVDKGVVYGPEEINDLPNSKNLFMFGFQTAEQLEVMKKHASKILVVDETHGTNQYQLKLLTVMVIDDDRHGWPVAFLLTSNSDNATLKFFFQALRSRVGSEIVFNCAMTDDDTALINAMEKGFAQKLIHLLCKWHVLKKFREHLRLKVPKDLVEPMYNELKVIMDAENEALFLQLKEGFILKHSENPDVSKFLEYLATYYWPRAKKWATCYRSFPHGGVNTTGHLESFHNRLKKWYLERKVNRRLDDLINILFSVAWDDYWARRRNASRQLCIQPHGIIERHQRGIKLRDEVIIDINGAGGVWEFKSDKTKDKTYIIERNKLCCDLATCVRCIQPECHGLCPHLYYCSCPDDHRLCKHIHKLHSFLFKDKVFVARKEQFYHFNVPISADECMDDTAHENGSETVHESPSDTAIDRKRRHNLEILRERTVSFAQILNNNPDQIPDHCISRGIALFSDLLGSAKVGSSTSVKNVSVMEPTVSFNSNEKLKTQESQSRFNKPKKKKHGGSFETKHVASFVIPKKKKRKEDISVRAAKKQTAKEDLLSYTARDECPVDNLVAVDENIDNPIDLKTLDWDTVDWQFS